MGFGGDGAVDAQDGCSIICEEEAGEGSWRCLLEMENRWWMRVGEHTRSQASEFKHLDAGEWWWTCHFCCLFTSLDASIGYRKDRKQ